MRAVLTGACVAVLSIFSSWGADVKSGPELAALFASQVDRRLEVPAVEQVRYAELLRETLAKTRPTLPTAQYVVLVDRSPAVQAIFVYWISENAVFHFIGASPVSTGKPGQFEYFETPSGVFDHTISNLDFRAEGTKNKFGVCGYGQKGMRVYDFGWIAAPRGWGDGHEGMMRLQMHATDPTLLEPSLGTVQSKGCIRIPATLNTFFDRYGLLDADYERAMIAGRKFFVMLPTREPTRWSGRYLVVVDTKRPERPAWSPSPGASKPRD